MCIQSLVTRILLLDQNLPTRGKYHDFILEDSDPEIECH